MSALAVLGRPEPRLEVAFGPGGARTVADLERDVLRVARALPGPAAGSHLAILCGDRYRFSVALLAAWHRGHAAALPPNERPATLAALLELPHVLELVHDTDEPRGLDLRPLLGEAGAGGVPDPRPPLAFEPDRVLATVYTSGTTGAPQGHAKTAAQLLLEAAVLGRALDLGPGVRVGATVPPHHLYGLLFGVLAPLARGAAFSTETPLHAETVAASVRERTIGVLVSVPAHLRTFSVLEPGALRPLDRVVSSTAPLDAETARDLEVRHGLRVTEFFGSTETGGLASREQARSPVWSPLEGVRVEIGAGGALLADSPFLPPDAPRPLRTGDLARLEGAGFVHLGRADGVVKVGGKRVDLAAVTERLLSLPGVADAAVTAVPAGGARGHEILAAAVAPGWTADRLRRALASWFEASTLPRRIRIAGALPRASNGKLPRDALLALFGILGEVRRLEVLGREREDGPRGTTHVVHLRVPEDLAYFQGHFPERPVLPGVVQLVTVVRAEIAAVAPALGSLRRVLRLKFRRIVGPGERLRLALTFRPDGRHVDFVLDRDGDACSAGTLEYAGDVGAGAGRPTP